MPVFNVNLYTEDILTCPGGKIEDLTNTAPSLQSLLLSSRFVCISNALHCEALDLYRTKGCEGKSLAASLQMNFFSFFLCYSDYLHINTLCTGQFVM